VTSGNSHAMEKKDISQQRQARGVPRIHAKCIKEQKEQTDPHFRKHRTTSTQIGPVRDTATAQAVWHREADLRLCTKPREKLAVDAATRLQEGLYVPENIKIRCDVLLEDVNKTPRPTALLDVGQGLERDDGNIVLAGVDDQNAFVAHVVHSAMDCSRSRRPLIQHWGLPKISANVKPGNLRPACPTAP